MANNQYDVIVWEFENDIAGLFSPYGDKVSNYIESEFNKDSRNTQVNLSNASISLDDIQINFPLMVQSNKHSRKERTIRRRLYGAATSALGKGISWQWLAERGWLVYHSEAVNAIEDCYQKGSDVCDLGILAQQLPNVVQLSTGYQKNKRTGFVRPIQRVTVSYKTDTPLSVKTDTPPSANNKGDDREKQHSKKKKNKSDAESRKEKTEKKKNKAQETAANGSEEKTKKLPVNHPLVTFCLICEDISEGEDCVICLSSLREEEASPQEEVLLLKICKHKYHKSCLEALYKQSSQQDGSLRCPLCKQIHGTLTGNQPAGRMSHRIEAHQSVAGYEGDGMIVITYEFPAGVQKAEHPNPGQRYTAFGFPRTAYLPANKKGKMVLKMLEVAFERKLVFTIGSSSTMGIQNTVTWTNIHHKTSPRVSGNDYGHSFPDPAYLDNVIDELRQNGVTPDDIKT